MKQFQISAKNLAKLNMEYTCPRCFWHLLQLKHKAPYNIFPGIFSTFDSLQKQLVEGHLSKTGKFPTWLGDMAGASKLADTPARFKHLHSGTNIILTGVPDHIFEWQDGSVSPVDYKTSRFSNGQDELKPLYAAQLDAYAYLLDKKCSLEIDRGALVYFEPAGAETMTITAKGYVQPWNVHVVGVDVSGEKTEELLDQAREIHDLQIAPDGAAECQDCALMENMARLVNKRGYKAQDMLRYLSPRERSMQLASDKFRYSASNIAKSAGNKIADPAKSPSLLLAWDWSQDE